MGLLELLGLFNSPSETGRDLGLLHGALSRHLAGMETDEVKKVAGFAGLLGKVAASDMEISREEVTAIESILVGVLGLSKAESAFLLDLIAHHRVQLFSVEDHIYARLVNELCSREEKQRLLEALFSVAAVDHSVSQEEDAVIWTIAKSLRLSHREFISARKQVAEHLDVLKRH